jgi:hypothetical protein
VPQPAADPPHAHAQSHSPWRERSLFKRVWIWKSGFFHAFNFFLGFFSAFFVFFTASPRNKFFLPEHFYECIDRFRRLTRREIVFAAQSADDFRAGVFTVDQFPDTRSRFVENEHIPVCGVINAFVQENHYSIIIKDPGKGPGILYR